MSTNVPQRSIGKITFHLFSFQSLASVTSSKWVHARLKPLTAISGRGKSNCTAIMILRFLKTLKQNKTTVTPNSEHSPFRVPLNIHHGTTAYLLTRWDSPFDTSIAWGLARGVYLVALTTQPSLEDYNMVYSVHACAARYNN